MHRTLMLLWRANPECHKEAQASGMQRTWDARREAVLPDLGGLCPKDCENSPDHSGQRNGRDGPLLSRSDLGKATAVVETVLLVPWSPALASSRFEPLPGTWDNGPGPLRWP